ncbi:hypothetical protein BC833DRAFT_623908 [Globomyces pollinis-pini]|nr:hypothetical protein BC833DRAFT_623908 [Globomyces pollinis-pini]
MSFKNPIWIGFTSRMVTLMFHIFQICWVYYASPSYHNKDILIDQMDRSVIYLLISAYFVSLTIVMIYLMFIEFWLNLSVLFKKGLVIKVSKFIKKNPFLLVLYAIIFNFVIGFSFLFIGIYFRDYSISIAIWERNVKGLIEIFIISISIPVLFDLIYAFFSYSNVIIQKKKGGWGLDDVNFLIIRLLIIGSVLVGLIAYNAMSIIQMDPEYLFKPIDRSSQIAFHPPEDPSTYSNIMFGATGSLISLIYLGKLITIVCVLDIANYSIENNNFVISGIVQDQALTS